MEWLTQDMLRKMASNKASSLGADSTTKAYKAMMGRKIPGADSSYIYILASDTKEIIPKLHKYYFEDDQEEE